MMVTEAEVSSLPDELQALVRLPDRLGEIFNETIMAALPPPAGQGPTEDIWAHIDLMRMRGAVRAVAHEQLMFYLSKHHAPRDAEAP